LKEFRTDWFLLVLFCCCCFAFNGGYVNAVSFAGVWKTGLTHLTGSTTNAAVKLVIPPKTGYTWYDLSYFILGFFLGAVVAGIVLGPPRLRWERLQGFLTVLMGVAMLLSWFSAPSVFGGTCVAFAMGIQNALTSNFSPMTIRTSHVTGTVLDLGMAIGQCISLRNLENMWKVKVHGPNYLSFWVGAVFGAYAWKYMLDDAILLSAFASIIGGALSLLYGQLKDYIWLPQPEEIQLQSEEKEEKPKETNEAEEDGEEMEPIMAKTEGEEKKGYGV